MYRMTSLFLILATAVSIGSTGMADVMGQEQSPSLSLAAEASDKLPLRLIAVLPDYKGPSRFVGRQALITFSPDGKLVAMSGTKRTITVWDTETGALKATLTGGKEGISGFAFSPDGRTAATRDYLDKSVRLWSVDTWESRATITGRKRDLETRLKSGFTYEQEFGPVAFSPDGRTVLSEREDDIVAVSDVANGEERFKLNHDTQNSGAKELLKVVFLGGSRHFLALQTGFSADGQLVFTINGDKSAKIWDAATGKLKTTVVNKERIYRASFSPDGRSLLTVEQEGGMKLWDAETGQLRGEVAKKGWLENLIKSFEFSSDGKTVATFYLGDTRLWDATTGEMKFKLLKTDTTDATFSPDGSLLATASHDKLSAGKIWDVKTGEAATTLASTGNKSVFVKFSPDGSLLVTTNDKGVNIWDAKNGALLATLAEARYPVAFSPDGRRLTTGARNDRAMLWEVPTR